MAARPAVAGAAAITQRIDDAGAGRSALDLMVDAVEAAADDAGGRSLLDRVGWVAVPEGIWPHTDPARAVAERIGRPGAQTVLAHVGVLQQTLLTMACERVATGEVEVAVVVGAEDRNRARMAERGGAVLDDPVAGGTPDTVLSPAGDVLTLLEMQRELATPANQYAVIESALQHRSGHTAAEHRRIVADRWAAFSRVAAENPDAWGPAPVDVDDLVEPRPPNRWIATPYTKLHCSQWTVDQAAAVIVCSPETARSLRIDADRLVHAHSAAESNTMIPLSARPALADSPGFRAVARAVVELAGTDVGRVDHLDLYSCFPSAVGIQIDALGLEGDPRPLTVTGAMSFAGGPLNNAVLMSMVRLVERLRAEPGSTGLITSVSGMFTKSGASIWSTGPPADGFESADVSDAGAETRTVVDELDGPAVIRGHTVVHDRDGPARAVAIVESVDQVRTVVTSDDRDLAQAMTTGEWCERPVTVSSPTFTVL